MERCCMMLHDVAWCCIRLRELETSYQVLDSQKWGLHKNVGCKVFAASARNWLLRTYPSAPIPKSLVLSLFISLGTCTLLNPGIYSQHCLPCVLTSFIPAAFAFKWLSMISSSSTFASNSSRTVLRASRASSIRSCWTSQRGDFGINGMQINRINAGPICIAIAQRQPSSKWTNLWSIKEARRIPAVIISWYTDVRHPRSDGGANSLW